MVIDNCYDVQLLCDYYEVRDWCCRLAVRVRVRGVRVRGHAVQGAGHHRHRSVRRVRNIRSAKSKLNILTITHYIWIHG